MSRRIQHHSRVKTVMSYILSFVLCLLFICLSLCAVFQVTVPNENFLQRQIVQSKYSQYALYAVQNELTSYGQASGFDQNFCKSLVSEREISSDANQLVKSIYENRTGPDYDAKEKIFYSQFAKNAEKRNIQMTEENKQAIKALSRVCAESYRKHVSFSAPVVSAMRSLIPKAKKLLVPVEAALGILAVIILVLLYNMHHKRHFFRYCIFATSGAALLFFAAGIGVLCSGKIECVGIVEQSLYELVVTCLHQIVFGTLIAAAVLAVFTAVLTIAYILQWQKHTGKKHDSQHSPGVYDGKLLI
ncbi:MULTISPECIES: hypothetical protein [Caproicibacterium]|uniref:Uncharacterized protein n=1 Tax=Caproicibacterium lactatifermentans TaxID=2666138 RepID=A0A859DPD3_9FIRM|nr:hypothetical protein [Caproicibacterium lactatifermentans]QKN23688.1 hypothetical protein GJQ69_03865 [Caproicibacterium lactatifermentans]